MNTFMFKIQSKRCVKREWRRSESNSCCINVSIMYFSFFLSWPLFLYPVLLSFSLAPLYCQMSLHHHPDTSPRNALRTWCREQVHLNEVIWQGLLLLAMRPPEGRKLPPIATIKTKKMGAAAAAAARDAASSRSVPIEASTNGRVSSGGDVSPLPQRRLKKPPGRFRSAPVPPPVPDPASSLAASAAPEWLRLLCTRAGPPPKHWHGPMNRMRGAGPRRRGAVGNAVVLADNAGDNDDDDGTNAESHDSKGGLPPKPKGKGGLSKVFNAEVFALPPKSSKTHGKHLKALIAEFLGVPIGRELRNLREALVILDAPWEDPDAIPRDDY